VINITGRPRENALRRLLNRIRALVCHDRHSDLSYTRRKDSAQSFWDLSDLKLDRRNWRQGNCTYSTDSESGATLSRPCSSREECTSHGCEKNRGWLRGTRFRVFPALYHFQLCSKTSSSSQPRPSVQWSNGYDFCLTHRRFGVRSSAELVFFLPHYSLLARARRAVGVATEYRNSQPTFCFEQLRSTPESCNEGWGTFHCVRQHIHIQHPSDVHAE
jgi:hypothetical protein